MRENNIIIRKAIMHILNTSKNHLEFSDNLLNADYDTCDFIRSHIAKIINSDDSKSCKFLKESSEVFNAISGFREEELEMISQEIAYHLYEVMSNNIEIPSANILIATFQLNSMIHMAILKLNYKEVFVHSIQKGQQGISNQITKQTTTLPSMTQSLTEAAVINLHDYSLKVIEKKYSINGVKENYFTNLFLKCETELSDKAKLNIVTKAIQRTNKIFYQNDIKKEIEAKTILYSENIENGEIDIEEVGEELYGHDVEILNEFNEMLLRYNLQNGKITPKSSSTIKKFEKQSLVTGQGIKIEIPMEQYLREDKFKIKENRDGTYEITIKDIELLKVK